MPSFAARPPRRKVGIPTTRRRPSAGSVAVVRRTHDSPAPESRVRIRPHLPKALSREIRTPPAWALRERETPRRAGLFPMRRRGLEPPPGYPGPGPQPGDPSVLCVQIASERPIRPAIRTDRTHWTEWMLSRIALSDRTLVISRLPRSRRATLDAVAGARSLRHHSNREPTEPRDARFSSSLAGVPTLAAETLASRRKGRDSGASPDYNAVGSAAPGCLGCGSSGRRAAVVFSDGGAEAPYINPV